MSKVTLKCRDKVVFLKAYNGVTGDIEFTQEPIEAKAYQSDWFATTELSYLQFHYPEYRKEFLDKMIPYYVEC